MDRLVQNTRLAVRIVSVVALLVVANVVVAQWDVKWDMTKSGLYSLSSQSESVASNVDRDVELIFFHTDRGSNRTPVNPLWVRILLKQYAGLSDRISSREVNPNVSPSETEQYGVRQNNAVVVKVGKKHKKLAPYDLVNFSRRGQNTFKGESAVTNAIKSLTTVTDRTVWFLTGHGEITVDGQQERSASSLRRAVENEGFSVDTLNPINDEFPPSDDLVVVLDPQNSFSSAVVDRIVTWNEEGGRLLVAGNPSNQSIVNSVVDPLGVSVQQRQILGQNWQFFYRSQGNPFLLSPTLSSHPVTDSLTEEGMSVVMGRTAPLDADTGTYDPLLKTSAEAYAKPLDESRQNIDPRFDPNRDLRGPFNVGVASDADDRGKVVALGNTDLFTGRLLGQAGNQNFATNLINWFFDRSVSLGIQPKPLSSNVVSVTPTQAYVIQFIALVGIPFTVLIWGGVVWWKRKNL